MSIVDLGWTPDFKAFFSLQDAFSFLTEDLLPLECLLQRFGYNIQTQKVIATNIYPIILSLIVHFSWIIFIFLVPSKNPYSKIDTMLQTIKISFFIVVVLLFPEVVSKCLSLFTCISVEDSNTVNVLLYAPDVICWSEEHKSYVKYAAVPGLVAWGLMAPIIIAYFLFKNKNDIKTIISEGNNFRSTFRKFSLTKTTLKPEKMEGLEKAVMLKFLFKGYCSKYFYWELIMFLKKFLLISIGCISDLFPSHLRGVFLLVIISILFLVHLKCEPFESKTLNKLETFSLLTTFLTANIGILLFSYDLKSIAFPILTFILFLHAFFLLYWVYLFLKEIVSQSTNIKLIQILMKKVKTTRRSVYPETKTTIKSIRFVDSWIKK